MQSAWNSTWHRLPAQQVLAIFTGQTRAQDLALSQRGTGISRKTVPGSSSMLWNKDGNVSCCERKTISGAQEVKELGSEGEMIPQLECL